MKTISLLHLLFVFACTAAADIATKIDGFMDTPWGVTEEAVKKNFASRSHARFDQFKSAPGKLRFNGGKFAKFKTREFNLEFTSDHFWMASAIFEPQSKDHAKEYATIKQLLVEKYGPPDEEEVRGLDHIANWHIGDQGEKNRIELHTETRGEGLRIMYAADGLRKTFSVAQAPAAPATPTAPANPAAASKAKPAPTAAGAKDDL